MTWTCEHIEERLSEFTDRLLAPADREAFTAHLGRCRKCMSLVKRVDAMTKTLHALEPLEPPARLVFAILDKTSKAEQKLPWWQRWFVPARQSRFAMGTVTVAMLFVVLTPVLGVQWNELSWSDLKPANLFSALDRRANLMYARGVKFVNEMRVVVEIQNMLQPASESQRKTSPEATPGEKEEEKPGQKTNRAREFEPVIPVSLAALHYGLPGRSN
jgi:hypothetical protein